ncbi:hypothetical protein F8388_001536 [Cannabis sativa]|uniref:DUF1985 domain-containing protein n=1 Tax=Cannabis sativa TaxID=3483 RepID=A0A7J6EM02_CANSA|nr:hypothetical protein F8388_001536 [Cannabis sativa]
MMMEGGETSDTRMQDLDSADDGFTQTVFSWTLEDISNENLYKVLYSHSVTVYVDCRLMVKTRSSTSPSASSKAMNPKNKSKETMSEGSDSGESDLSSKRKRNNAGSKKGKSADRLLKKMKQVVEEDDVEYDSDDLEIGVPDSTSKNGKEMWFKFGCENFRFSLAEFAVITGLLCNGDNDMKKYAKRENAFVDKYFFEQQVTHGAVEQRFMFSGFKSDEYAVKMAILYLLTNGLICSPAVKKVFDELMNIVGLGEYDSFPWEKINDDDLVLTNEEELVVEVEKVEDEMLVDNKVEEVLDDTIVENKNDGGSQPTFDIMCFITSQPSDDNGNDDKKEVVDDDHEMFKNGSNKLREDNNDGDDKGIGGDEVGAKEVKGGGNVGASSGGVSAGESAVKEGEEVVGGGVNEKVADDKVIYDETKECTVAVTKKLGDSQGTEDSITLFTLEKINDIEEKIAKVFLCSCLVIVMDY